MGVGGKNTGRDRWVGSRPGQSHLSKAVTGPLVRSTGKENGAGVSHDRPFCDTPLYHHLPLLLGSSSGH